MACSVDAVKLTIRRLLTEDSTPDDVVDVSQDSRRGGRRVTGLQTTWSTYCCDSDTKRRSIATTTVTPSSPGWQLIHGRWRSRADAASSTPASRRGTCRSRRPPRRSAASPDRPGDRRPSKRSRRRVASSPSKPGWLRRWRPWKDWRQAVLPRGTPATRTGRLRWRRNDERMWHSLHLEYALSCTCVAAHLWDYIAALPIPNAAW